MQLQFKHKYVDLILSGAKTQTLRAKPPRGARVGVSLTLRNGYGPRALFARAVVASVDEVRVSDLTESDARLGGFASLTSLLDELATLYRAPEILYRVRWCDLRPVTYDARSGSPRS